MTLELPLVEVFVIEHPECRCQATQCPDEQELRRNALHDETKSDVRRELQTCLSFTLRLGQRISRRQKKRVPSIAAVSCSDEIADPDRGIESATRELLPCPDMFRPRHELRPKSQ